ncbi:MAG: ROK family transcriptional regulator [Marmoricola sp.]
MPQDAGPAATDEVRRRNSAVLLRLLRDDGPLSRADLARRSGLAKATIGAIVAQLQEQGAVAEGAVESGGLGRPSTPLQLAGQELAGLGVEINVDYVALTALDLAGRELSFVERAVDGARPGPDDVRRLVREEVTALSSRGIDLLGITVAVPGLIDRRRGLVVDAPNLGWNDLRLAEILSTELGGRVPVAVDNDANCAVRAESLRGVATGVEDFIYLTGTVGLGAGILSAGQVLRGSRGLAGEVGHLRVGSARHRCACGRTGCWEAMVGLRALVEATGVTVEHGEDPVTYAERVAVIPGARRGLLRIGEALGRGVAQLAVTLDPGMVVLGGSFVPLGEVLVPAVEAALAEAFTGPGCVVALSTLGLHAASVGAAVDALDDIYAGRRALPV